LWTALLATAGYLLQDQYQRVGEYLNPVSDVIVGLIVLGYLYRVVTFRQRQAH
jgi:membrane protein DedA with SNARE-associated domain